MENIIQFVGLMANTVFVVLHDFNDECLKASSTEKKYNNTHFLSMKSTIYP